MDVRVWNHLACSYLNKTVEELHDAQEQEKNQSSIFNHQTSKVINNQSAGGNSHQSRGAQGLREGPELARARGCSCLQG